MHLFSMKKVTVTSVFAIAFTVKAIGNKGQILGCSITHRSWEAPQGSNLRVSAKTDYSTIAYTIEALVDDRCVDIQEFQETLELPPETEDIRVCVRITE